jgi:hypothetical protein
MGGEFIILGPDGKLVIPSGVELSAVVDQSQP